MKTNRKDPEAVSLLTPEQHRVTHQDGTERPFQNEYRDNKEPGLHVDVVSGEQLFASVDKFDSRTGWPSFTTPGGGR
jgi:peptide-methionine (R)-S-oxide reductase